MPSGMPLLATLGLGFALGLRHALDADHVAAVSTFVARDRSLRRSSAVGAYWGLGHTVSLLLASFVVIGLRRAIPTGAALALELGVGLMLVLLGLDLFRRLAKGDLTVHSHAHGHAPAGEAEAGGGHAHLHVHAEGEVHAEAGSHHVAGRRPFLVGLVHGLAGSAALTLFVLSTIPSVWAGLAYVALFALGTMVGMAVMTTLVALPFALAARATSRFSTRVQAVAAFASVGIGLWHSWQALVGKGLVE